MDRLDTKSILSGQEFTFSTQITIDSSYDNLTDTASLIIPKRIKYRKEDGAEVDAITRGENPLFKIGDPATIEIGYNSLLKPFFSGYISGIRQKFPLRFNLEDPVFVLKQSNLSLSMNNPKLSELLKKVIPSGIEYEVTAEQNLGKFRVNNSSPAAILDELRKKHGIYSFFRDDVLYVGLSVNPSLQTTHRFQFFTPQIIDGDKLTYIDAKERKIKVICKSIDSNNKALEATAGDADGEVRTLYFNNYTLADLQSTADRLKDELRYSGYSGYFTIFASSNVKHGDIIELINKEIPEQNGGYLTPRVKTRAGWGIGGRQDVYIKQKIYDLVSDGNGGYIQQNITE
tara:strand:- start:5491 stop:6522 length:1032 start_codon:yes stop_codon:yes gene_type:complete